MARSESVKQQRSQRVEYAKNLRATTPCTDCGIQYPYYVMEFDHVRGEKVANVMLIAGIGSWKTLLLEIAKCEIVCGNCHSVRTHYRRVGQNEPNATGTN